MILSNHLPSKKKQDGLVLLVLVIIILLSVSTYYFSSISIVEIQVDKIKNTQIVLNRAKQALLDYAVVNWNLVGEAGKIGKLPCPDDNNSGPNGEQDGNCGVAYANAIGYFPWRTLRLEQTNDSSGSCLLYGVAPAYKTSPVAALNPDSYGQFRIVDSTGAILQGIAPEDRPVAVIIAPGSALAGQEREDNNVDVCGSYYSDDISDLIAAYLDNDGTTNNAAIDPGTGDVIENLVSAIIGSDETDNPLNDRLITISHREFWDNMQNTITSVAFDNRMRDLTEAIAMCFAAYGSSNVNNNLPMPAPLDVGAGEYRRNVDYDASGNFITAFAGRLPYDVSSANNFLVNGNAPNIFDNTFCDDIDFIGTVIDEDIHFNDDNGLDNGEYFDLWQNWKDHFFYVVSERFNPNGAGTIAPCGGDCVDVNGTEYAAIIFFSGLKLNLLSVPPSPVPQSRYAPPFEVDEKNGINNYLEDINAANFTDNTGNANYNPVDALTSNDVMFCIRQDMSVVECL